MMQRIAFVALLIILVGTVAFVARHGMTVNGTCAYLCVNGK